MNTIEQNIISHQIWLQRLATQTSSLSIPFINKMREEVREATLSFGDDARTVKKLNKLMDSLNGVLEDVTGDWKKTIEKELRSIADYENKWFKHTLESGVRKDLKSHILAPTAEELWSAIKFTPMSAGSQPVGLIDALDGWTISEKNRLVRGVQSGFIQGQTTRQIVKNVVGAGGLADVSERGATAIVRTAVNHVSTQAKIEVGKANEDIVSGYEIVITLDSRTSAICRNLPHGKVYEFGKGPMPPLHYNCRDTIVPKIEDDFLDFLDEGAVRAARGADGGMQVDANTSYYDFLKSQPAFFQDEALGPIRGKIFRESGMSPEQFRAASIDGFNRPMTIQQMAENDKLVADYLAKINYKIN